MSTHQQMQRSNNRPLESAQSRLALLSYLTQKKQGSSQYKKKAFFWDQEYLYSQNLMLRSQIKQLTQANTKAKTSILQMQQQLKAKHTRNNDQNYKQTVFRSMSLRNLGKKSLTFVRSHHEEQGPSKPIRKLIRQLKQQIQKLKNQNTQLKRSMKYTRMSELQTLNKQMQIQMQRLNRLTNDIKDKYYTLTIQFQVIREHLRRENQAKVMAFRERDKLKREKYQIKKEIAELVRKKQINIRHISQDSKKLKSLNPQTRASHNIQKNNAKIQELTFKSFAKLQYSISGLDKVQNQTINFDKLINTESQLKSAPKIASFTSLQLQKQPTNNEDSLKQAEYSEEEYEFQQEQQQNKQQTLHKQQNQEMAKSQKQQLKNKAQKQPTKPSIIQSKTSKQKDLPDSIDEASVQQVPAQDQMYEDLMQQQFD